MESFGILNPKNIKRVTEELKNETLNNLILALEHKTYKTIPKTRCSYRQDSQNTNTKTQKHLHVYAKENGKGNQLYAVNIDGSGHDGSSGVVIPSSHAEHFRAGGYDIPDSLTLESMDSSILNPDDFEVCILES